MCSTQACEITFSTCLPIVKVLQRVEVFCDGNQNQFFDR